MVDKDELLARVRQEAKLKHVRWTGQRRCIVETFVNGGRHMSVDELYQQVRELDSSVSPATVYRTMNLLVEIGVAVKRIFEQGSASFELIVDRHHHDHLIDVDTGEVHEFTNEEIEELQQLVARRLGYELTDHRLVLYGKRVKEDSLSGD